VANAGDSSVTVIDGATSGTTAVTVGANPRALGVNLITNKVYVVNSGTNKVTVIDGATNDTLTLPAGTNPWAVSVNPLTGRIYVANNGSDNVTVINGYTNTTTQVAAGDAPCAVAANPATNKIYVANNGSDNVTVIDGATNQTTTVTAGQNPWAVAVNPMTNKIYVANNGSDNVTVIDGAADTTFTVAAGAGPVSVTVNPVNNKVYVANSEDGTITVIDGAGNGTTTVTADSGSYAVAVNPVNNKVYVTNSAAGSVTVIDEVPIVDTKVRAEIDGLAGHVTELAQPTLTGTAVNHQDSVHNVMMGVLGRRGTAQQIFSWADITSGAGTDSVAWSFAWGTDSLTSGENFICVVPMEMDAATTNNEGLGSPFAGNMVVYPLYRTWGLGLQEPASSSSPFRPFGTTMLRGALVMPGASSRNPQAASLLDISGRKVMDLRPGANDVRALAPGIYFVRAVGLEQSAAGCHKVVVTH